MVIVLLVITVLGALMGWLYTTERFWGIAWVGNLHALLTWPLVLLVAVHVMGALHAGRHHHENLIAAMIHGRKRPIDRE